MRQEVTTAGPASTRFPPRRAVSKRTLLDLMHATVPGPRGFGRTTGHLSPGGTRALPEVDKLGTECYGARLMLTRFTAATTPSLPAIP